MPVSEVYCSVLSLGAAAFISMGTEDPASAPAWTLIASATFLVGAGLKAFVVSMTASNTLAILLFLGVAAGAFHTYDNSAFDGGLIINF
jgi:hypothetical protein